MFSKTIQNYRVPKEQDRFAQRNKKGQKHVLEEHIPLNEALENYRFHKIKSKSFNKKY